MNFALGGEFTVMSFEEGPGFSFSLFFFSFSLACVNTVSDQLVLS